MCRACFGDEGGPWAVSALEEDPLKAPGKKGQSTSGQSPPLLLLSLLSALVLVSIQSSAAMGELAEGLKPNGMTLLAYLCHPS